MYNRWQKARLEEALRTRRVVLLAGARQSGKTTLSRAITLNDVTYRSLDDDDFLKQARNDPKAFVAHNSKTLVIDEVQHVPELLPAIKMVVDQDNRPGQYLLTGSADIWSLPTVTESLAGRISTVRLRTLTQGEILGGEPMFLKNAFDRSFSKLPSSHTLTDILKIAFRGGFPEVVGLDVRKRREWHSDYIDALLAKDLKDLTNIKKYESMHKLINVLAAWSSKFMDIVAIGSSLEITRQTVESYIFALEMLYLVEYVPSWVQTDYARVSRKGKLFMTDTGLMASMLDWNIDEVTLNSDRLGKIFETLVFNELAAQIDASKDVRYKLFQYRDREKREIDFIIERESEALLGIEVKASSSVRPEDFKHMKWFAANIAKDRSFIGIVLYSGENFLRFGENMLAVPIAFLWK